MTALKMFFTAMGTETSRAELAASEKARAVFLANQERELSALLVRANKLRESLGSRLTFADSTPRNPAKQEAMTRLGLARDTVTRSGLNAIGGGL